MRRTLRIPAATAVLLVAVCFVSRADNTMSKDEWQNEMTKYTGMRDALSAKDKSLTDEIASLQGQSTKLDADYTQCRSELYALVGSNAEQAAAYSTRIAEAEAKANELLKLSDADLISRSGEVKDLAATVKQLWDNKLSLIPEFWDRLTALNDDVKKLETTIAGKEKMYTVRSWSRYRDCLWNISKNKTIYGDPWKWPKIWQDNRDQIHDPDLIHVGEKLRIPPAGPLTAEEQSAAKTYYAKEARSSKSMAGK